MGNNLENEKTVLKQGEELNQLSRLLFDAAAHSWYLAIFFEVLAGLSVIPSEFIELSDDWKITFAIVGFIFLAIAYYLRLKFENDYDRAETMRRQSVLTEALGCPISVTQFSDWRLRAGRNILNSFKLKQRDDDYYATQKPVGADRLLEMTTESAFYTRHLYSRLKTLVWTLFILAIFLSFLVISISPLSIISDKSHMYIVYVIYLFLPIILSIDLLGWALKLGRLIISIKEIEKDLERLAEQKEISEMKIMRLVSEYNCQLACGFPIHNRLFHLWHNEINELWKKRTQ